MAYAEVVHYHDDDDSVVSSVYSQHSEPEGEFRDDDDYEGFVYIPQPPLAPNIVIEGVGPNLVPEGDKSIQALAYCILYILFRSLCTVMKLQYRAWEGVSS